MVLEFEQKLIGTFKLSFEYKFSRGGSLVIFFEDLVVNKEF